MKYYTKDLDLIREALQADGHEVQFAGQTVNKEVLDILREHVEAGVAMSLEHAQKIWLAQFVVNGINMVVSGWIDQDFNVKQHSNGKYYLLAEKSIQDSDDYEAIVLFEILDEKDRADLNIDGFNV